MTELEQKILDLLSEDHYMTKNLIMQKTGKGRTAIKSALNMLHEADLVDTVLVRATPHCGKPEIAYLKLC